MNNVMYIIAGILILILLLSMYNYCENSFNIVENLVNPPKNENAVQESENAVIKESDNAVVQESENVVVQEKVQDKMYALNKEIGPVAMPSSNMSAKKKTINDTCEKCFNYNVSRLTSLSWDPLGSPWLPTNNKQANEKADAMSDDWQGADYTKNLIKKGVYAGNTVT